MEAPLIHLRENLSHLIRITDQEWELWVAELETRQLKKGSFLTRESEIWGECYFLTKGILRNILVSEGKEELTTSFTVANNFLMDYGSYVLKRPSIYRVQAMTDSEILVFPRSFVDSSYEEAQGGNKLGRLIAEYQYIQLEDKLNAVYSLTIEERYEELIVTFPEIHNNVPQHMIASYLGISRVHLSRLKAKKRLPQMHSSGLE